MFSKKRLVLIIVIIFIFSISIIVTEKKLSSEESADQGGSKKMAELKEHIIKRNIYEIEREEKSRKRLKKEKKELALETYVKLSEMLEAMELHNELLPEVKDHPKKIRDLEKKINLLKDELWETMGTKSKNKKFQELYKKFQELKVNRTELDGSEFNKKKK